ncbi:MAG: hypothetical protein ACK4MV_15225 [Beijerinckiaceae bacterium]
MIVHAFERVDRQIKSRAYCNNRQSHHDKPPNGVNVLRVRPEVQNCEQSLRNDKDAREEPDVDCERSIVEDRYAVLTPDRRSSRFVAGRIIRHLIWSPASRRRRGKLSSLLRLILFGKVPLVHGVVPDPQSLAARGGAAETLDIALSSGNDRCLQRNA